MSKAIAFDNWKFIFGKYSVPSKYIIQPKFAPIIFPDVFPFLIIFLFSLLKICLVFYLLKVSIIFLLLLRIFSLIKYYYLLIHNIYLFYQLKYYDLHLLIFVHFQYKLYHHNPSQNLEYVKLLILSYLEIILS